jgi:hypothetical protein
MQCEIGRRFGFRRSCRHSSGEHSAQNIGKINFVIQLIRIDGSVCKYYTCAIRNRFPINYEMLDRDIRPPLRKALRSWHRDAVLVEEMPLCRKGRADVAVVNCSLWGYEIKSERDSLNRLPLQIANYDAVFDYSTVVAAERHIRYAKRVVPRHWGIRVLGGASEEPSFEVIRDPKRNAHTSPEAIVRLLWKTEVLRILRAKGIGLGSQTPILQLWDALSDLPQCELSFAVREALKLRHRQVDSQQTSSGDLFPIVPTAAEHQYWPHFEPAG